MWHQCKLMASFSSCISTHTRAHPLTGLLITSHKFRYQREVTIIISCYLFWRGGGLTRRVQRRRRRRRFAQVTVISNARVFVYVGVKGSSRRVTWFMAALSFFYYRRRRRFRREGVATNQQRLALRTSSYFKACLDLAEILWPSTTTVTFQLR